MLADRIRNWPLIRPKDGTPQKGGRKESERDRERREKGRQLRLSRTDGENYHTCCQHIALLMSNWICSLAGAIPPHTRFPYSPSSAATGYYVGGITTAARGCEATNSSVNFTWTDNFTQFVRADEQSFPICMRLRVAPTNSHAPINTQPTAHSPLFPILLASSSSSSCSSFGLKVPIRDFRLNYFSWAHEKPKFCMIFAWQTCNLPRPHCLHAAQTAECCFLWQSIYFLPKM